MFRSYCWRAAGSDRAAEHSKLCPSDQPEEPSAWPLDTEGDVRNIQLNFTITFHTQTTVHQKRSSHNDKMSFLLLQVACSGRHTLRVTGVSNLDFRAGFSSVVVNEFSRTRERPIKGNVG